MLFSLLVGVYGLFEGTIAAAKEVRIEDASFRLSYLVTTLILCCCAVLLGTSDAFGNDINCWHSDKIVNQYCWITGTTSSWEYGLDCDEANE